MKSIIIILIVIAVSVGAYFIFMAKKVVEPGTQGTTQTTSIPFGDIDPSNNL